MEIWFIKDNEKAIKIRVFNTIIKITTCILYIVQVVLDSPSENQSVLSASNSTDDIIWFVW